MARFSLEEIPPSYYPDGYWENRRKHPPIKPGYKRTTKDDEYWKTKREANEKAAIELNRKAGVVMSQLKDSAESTPLTANEYKEAAEEQRQEKLDKLGDYKKGIKATITAAELGLSGASLLGAYANWKNWANATSASKQVIANLLKKAQAPLQVGGTLIDSYQTYDAATQGDDFNKWYNAISALMGASGYVGALDVFRGRSPMIDRIFDTSGIMQNSGDYLKFIYDTSNSKDNK